MAFTEFYCQTTGSNLNAGSTTSDSALFTFTNGNWDGASVFIATGADLSAVSVGMFASVYNDGASVAVFVSRITAVNDTTDTITVSTTAKSGTAPTVSVTGRSIKIGGAWQGPNGAVGFPFGFVTNAQTNVAVDYPRVNFKSGTNYAITAAMTHANIGPIIFQGYTTTVGDGGKATIDGGTSGASYILFTLSAAGYVCLEDLVFQNNGATGSANGIVVSGSGGNQMRRCVVSNIRNSGLNASGSESRFIECEFFACNQANANSNTAGAILGNGATIWRRCIFRDNTGSNGSGFFTSSNMASMESCVFESNGQHGFSSGTSSANVNLSRCEFYNNATDGVRLGNANPISVLIENCNFIKNGGWAFNGSGAGNRTGNITNCGFGAGTQVNTSGTTTGLKSMVEPGSVTYAANVTPWVDPANGDFRINLAAAKGAGRGAFTQTAPSYTGTIGYPDIGAAQHLDRGETSHTFA